MTSPSAPTTRGTRAADRLVSTVDHRATDAALALLDAGGSAVDAAVAANAVLAVTAPHLCGMGGDLFALVHEGAGSPVALNASGRAGSGADAAALRDEGFAEVPFRADPRAVTVPGCVDGWMALHDRYGRLPLDAVLAPAARLAEDGFQVGPLLAALVPLVSAVPGAEEWVRRTLSADDRIHRPGSAAALRAVAESGRDGFYQGAFGAGLIDLGDGVFTPADLARSEADWVTPLSATAWGHEIWTIPPNSQGYLALAGAVAADRLGIHAAADEASVHALIEICRLVGHDRPEVLHDQAVGAALVADATARAEAEGVGEPAAGRRAPSASGDTTYLAVVASGMAVSLIQSNAADFGAHIVEPATGIFLHNRGIGFSTEEGHPAELAARRRPPHTLSPLLVTNTNRRLRGVLGTMGGDSQPQILLQLLARWLAGGDDPATTISAARWVLGDGEGRAFDLWTRSAPPAVRLESHAPAAWTPGLTRRGHRVVSTDPYLGAFGHAHLISVEPDGSLAGAADPRAVIGRCA